MKPEDFLKEMNEVIGGGLLKEANLDCEHLLGTHSTGCGDDTAFIHEDNASEIKELLYTFDGCRFKYCAYCGIQLITDKLAKDTGGKV